MLDVLTATITQLHQRLTSLAINSESRQDIAVDLLSTEHLRNFAMVVAA